MAARETIGGLAGVDYPEREDIMGKIAAFLLAGSIAAGLACSSDGSGPSGGCKDAGGGPAGTVTVGNIFFRSGHNGSCNAAVDTIPAGTAVTWTWVGTGGTSHGIQSTGSPSFPSSTVMSGAGSSYAFTFMTAGTYQYDCTVHGTQMTGRIVVQ